MRLQTVSRPAWVRARALRAAAALLAAVLFLPCAPQAFAQSRPAAAGASPPAKQQGTRPAGKASWNELSAAQQAALQPLAPIWGDISDNRKRKWIALSANFAALSPADQATLHGRMTEWASLSTADRNRARLNFAQTKQLSNQEKKAQWEAYQALSPEQKQQLAAQAQNKTSGAAPAVSESAPGKLAAVPTTRSDAATATTRPSANRTARPSARASAAGSTAP